MRLLLHFLPVGVPPLGGADRHETLGRCELSFYVARVIAEKVCLGIRRIESRRTVADVEAKKVEVSPHWEAKDFSIQMSIPNGTRVMMVDAQGLNYVWVDGPVFPGLRAAADQKNGQDH